MQPRRGAGGRRDRGRGLAWRDEAGDFLGLLKPAGSPGEGREFVEMLRVTRGCLD